MQHLASPSRRCRSRRPMPTTALREARRRSRSMPRTSTPRRMVAFAYYHKKLYDTAELVLDDLFKRRRGEDRTPTSTTSTGSIYDHTNRPERAMLAYQKAVQLNPNLASALVNLGVHQLQNKQYARGAGDVRAADQGVQPQRRGDADLARLGVPRPLGRLSAGLGGAQHSYVHAGRGGLQAGARRPTRTTGRPTTTSACSTSTRSVPVGRRALDTMQRLNAAKAFLDQYKNMPGVDIKLYDARMKDVDQGHQAREKKKQQARRRG